MDPASELMHSFLDGVDQGTAKAVTIGTTAAAAAAWRRVRASIRRRQPSLDSGERAVLDAEPGQVVDVPTLLRLLQLLPAEVVTSIKVQGDYIARDKNISVQGDYIEGNRY
jgi:hypothetical protein